MLTKATAKFIKSLQLKKYRKQEQLFVVEGTKNVLEFINSGFKIKLLVVSEGFVEAHDLGDQHEIIIASRKELGAIGSYKTNDGAIAVVHQKENEAFDIQDELALALDDVNDPGNLGTIIRIADWYGIKKVVASTNTVDLYNPKVVAAAKGSLSRVAVYYTGLPEYLQNQSCEKYGAFMEGENIHKQSLNSSALIVMGNEANGVSEEVEKLIDKKVAIPRFGEAESLNVAMATAVICDNFRR